MRLAGTDGVLLLHIYSISKPDPTGTGPLGPLVRTSLQFYHPRHKEGLFMIIPTHENATSLEAFWGGKRQ